MELMLSTFHGVVFLLKFFENGKDIMSLFCLWSEMVFICLPFCFWAQPGHMSPSLRLGCTPGPSPTPGGSFTFSALQQFSNHPDHMRSVSCFPLLIIIYPSEISEMFLLCIKARYFPSLSLSLELWTPSLEQRARLVRYFEDPPATETVGTGTPILPAGSL
jgi:hypothetical protein